MLKTMGAVVLAAGVFAAAGYGAGTAKAAPEPAKARRVEGVPPKTPPLLTINDSMTHVMAVEAQTIWDVSSKAFNYQGDGLDPKKLNDKDWKALELAGGRVTIGNCTE